MIERHRYSSRTQNREIADYPFGRILGDQQHTIAQLDSARTKQQPRAMSAVAQLAIDNRGSLSRRLAHFQRGACAVTLRRALEHLDQVLVPKRSAWPRARVQF